MAKLKENVPSAPGAWVVSSKDRGRKSIKNGKVYLKDNEEFQIELYNPLKYSVLADIKLNGISISTNGLVLRPAERFYLDCFIDDKKKFIFKTYEVEKTKENIESISKNGLLEVYFYQETITTISNWYNKLNWTYYPYYQQPYYYHGGSITATQLHRTTTVPHNGTTSISIANSNGSVLFNTSTDGSELSNVNTSTSTSYYYNSILNTSSMNTGRVEKGVKSNQHFEYIDKDFQPFYISSTIVTILPETEKPMDTKDVNKSNKNVNTNDAYHVLTLIKKLSDLHTEGILTDEEYNSKKTELLSKI